ncbi:MAG: TetR/AcrR family transcriptional regulator [Rikenellaceae bacterium]
MKKKIEQTGNITSTKEVILRKSLEMINQGGMMDFRIDVLALSLNLSPGNITYHFAKKEDISVLLWQQFLVRFDKTLSCVSHILDIKQTFLVFRELALVIYDLRGVVMFVGADSRVIKDKSYNVVDFYDITKNLFKSIGDLLYRNGYLYQPPKDNHIMAYQTIMLRWWINKAIIKNGTKIETKDQIINHNSLLMLFSIYGQMNDKAKTEFEYIAKKVAQNDI